MDKIEAARQGKGLIVLEDASAEQVKQAIEQVASAIKPGGYYITSEGWQEGVDKINSIRGETGIDPMKIVVHNRYMKREEFQPFVSQQFEIVNKINFGFYYWFNL